MTDVTYVIIDEVEPIFDGVARCARAELGVTAWGMQVLTLPPNWDGYPRRNHDATTGEAGRRRSTSHWTGRQCSSPTSSASSWRPG